MCSWCSLGIATWRDHMKQASAATRPIFGGQSSPLPGLLQLAHKFALPYRSTHGDSAAEFADGLRALLSFVPVRVTAHYI